MVPSLSNSVTCVCMCGSASWNHSSLSFFLSVHTVGGVHPMMVCSFSVSDRSYHGSVKVGVVGTREATALLMLINVCILWSCVCVQWSSRCSSLPIAAPIPGAAFPHVVRSGIHAGQNLSA